MRIYFAGSIRGGRADQPRYAEFISLLKKFGEVLDEHVADETLSHFGETDIAKEEIHQREMNSIEACRVFVAEVSTPSLGVGYEIARALELGKKVLCFYEGGDTYKLSAMIKGDKRLRVFSYQTMEEVEAVLKKELVF
jgi:hypothetical protein